MSAPKRKWKGYLCMALSVLLALGFLAWMIALTVKLDRQTTTETLGGEAYSIGLLSESGEYQEGETAIYTRKGITVNGLKCDLQDEATVKYELFFYDKDGKFISKSGDQTDDWKGSVPETAKTVKVMITPTSDEDGKVSVIEVLGYANQLTVTVNR